MDFFKNISINKKLVLSFLVLALVPLIIIGLYSIKTLSSSLKSFILTNEQNRVETKVMALSGFLQGIESDLFVISNASALKNLIEGVSIDDPDEVQYWRDELSETFKSFADSKKIYMQVRFLTSNGNELVRVDYDGKAAAIIPSDKLQNKLSASYFQNTIKLNARGVFISPLNLNKERGKIEVPHKPVIRYATPVFDRNGKRQGIVILNVLAVNFLSEFKKVSSGNMFLVNSNGYYLANTDLKKEFGFMFSKPELSLAADYPKFGNNIITGKKNGVIQNHPNEILTYKPILPDRNDPDRYWMAVRGVDKGIIFKPVDSLKTTFAVILAVTIAVISFLSFYIARSISGPIQKIIVNLNEASDQVSSASGQISSSSQELARGATEQAASLEETSSSLEEMAAVTKENSKNAEGANQLSVQTKTAAEDGAKAMTNMHAAMQEINNSSGKISKIIKVIEEIAFQTNLLALNAAVEAARAGEAGKGFAVVAEEVRNLAQRSAAAAKDTASLIEESVSRAENGTKIAGEAGEALKVIISNVNTMTDLVSQISHASKEQADGVTQVNKAVAQMDKVTQQNASNAEETASASEELSAQSEGLKEMVDQLVIIVGAIEKDSSHKVIEKAVLAAKIPTKTLVAPKPFSPAAKQTHEKSKLVVEPNDVIPMDDKDF